MRALCKGVTNTDMWFDPELFDQAKQICEQCPVRAICSQAAVDNDEAYGVWGGKTPRERGYSHDEAG